MSRQPPEGAAQERRKSSLATLRGLVPFLAPYARQFALAGVALVVAAGATLAIPYAFKQMIDLGFGAAGSKSIEHVDLYFLALFGVACVLGVFTAARFYMVSWLGERVTADLRNAVYAPRRHAEPAVLRDHADRRGAVAPDHRHDADADRGRHQHLDGAAQRAALRRRPGACCS